MAASNPSTMTALSSPTLSAISTSSSFDMISSISRSPTIASPSVHTSDDDSDDEIVWSVSEASLSSSDLSTESNVSELAASDDDFVVLMAPRTGADMNTPTPIVAQHVHSSPDVDITQGLARLALTESALAPSGQPISNSIVTQPQPGTNGEGIHKPIRRRNRRQVAASRAARAVGSYPSPAPSPNSEERGASTVTLTRNVPSQAKVTPAVNLKKPRSKRNKKKTVVGLGERPIVDDVSELASEQGDETLEVQSMYQEAVKYITSFISNPVAKDSVSRLTLLQCLIIELGLSSTSPIAAPSLPGSMKAAKALIKSSAFLNIREYLAVRGQGQAALQRVMHPSRSALIKDIRRKKNPAPIKWVKQTGLQVLLVTCHH